MAITTCPGCSEALVHDEPEGPTDLQMLSETDGRTSLIVNRFFIHQCADGTYETGGNNGTA